MANRCGDCLLFNTPKCTWLYSRELKTETKEVHTWKEFLEWLYNFNYLRIPLPFTGKLVRNLILPTDIACVGFIREK